MSMNWIFLGDLSLLFYHSYCKILSVLLDKTTAEKTLSENKKKSLLHFVLVKVEISWQHLCLQFFSYLTFRPEPLNAEKNSVKTRGFKICLWQFWNFPFYFCFRLFTFYQHYFLLVIITFCLNRISPVLPNTLHQRRDYFTEKPRLKDLYLGMHPGSLEKIFQHIIKLSVCFCSTLPHFCHEYKWERWGELRQNLEENYSDMFNTFFFWNIEQTQVEKHRKMIFFWDFWTHRLLSDFIPIVL